MVRTPRFAVFVDENNPYWRTAVAALVRIFSQTWGGKYFIIVPTDGKRIKDKYWELLEAYSPDQLGAYRVTLADLQEADPTRYEATVAAWRKDWKFDQDFDEWFKEQQYLTSIGDFKIGNALEQELKNRLAPFHPADHVVQDWLIRDHGTSFPFTNVTDINLHAHRPVKKLVLPKPTDDLDLRAMVLSQSGDLNKPALDEYAKQAVSSTVLPSAYKTEDMVESVMRGSVDPTDLKLKKALADALQDEPGAWSPDEDFVGHMPFQASMLHLARYYRSDIHRDYQEPVTVVVGDTVDDFCLYYCLSRLHDEVFWLPKKWLDECERRRVNNLRLHRRGRPTRDYSENARVASAVVRLAYRVIKFGHSEKQIELRSMSLSTDDLKRSVAAMDRNHWGARGELTSHARVVVLADTSTECVARVIEENNYMNQQEMVFINGKSVGRVATPKPKNFSLVDPASHRWLTSLQISDYTPPHLPFLGSQVALTHESRIATDGIVYLCPGIAFFGGDIDVNLTRPELVMVSAREILRQYFAEAGLEIRPSDKGNYLTDTISRFGGLSPAANFIGDSKTRGILDLFLITKSAKGGYVVYLQEEKRAYISYDGVKNCVGEDTAARVIDELVGKDILKRGLIFLCTRCRLSSWYSLADLTTEFTCRRCSHRQQFTKTNWKAPEEPRWYYALAETVLQCYTHNSYLTILALDHLKGKSKDSFQYLPEIDVINFPAQGDMHEIDIACLVDGRVVLGECKTERLRPSHTDKYEALAKALVRGPDEVVFATSHEQVSQAFLQKIGGIPRSSLLTGKDLMNEGESRS